MFINQHDWNTNVDQDIKTAIYLNLLYSSVARTIVEITHICISL